MNEFQSGAGETTGTATKLQEQVSEKAKGVRDKVADLGRQTVDKIDAQREPAAVTLHETADSVRKQAEKASSLAQTTADKLEATADYVRNNDVKAMAEDVGEIVKRYPGQALAAAVIVGFLLGRVLQNND